MRFLRVLKAASLLFVLLPSVSVEASMVERLTFGEISREAPVIVQAVVLQNSRRTELRDGIPWTCFVLAIERTIKGPVRKNQDVCFLGGPVGTTKLFVTGTDLPQEGKKGIFFLNEPAVTYVNPLIGWTQGLYYIATAPNGREVVTDSSGQSISRIDLINPTSVPGSGLSALGIDTRPAPGDAVVSPDTFIESVHQALIGPR